MKLLYAEDEPAMAEAVADILTYHNYLVDTVGNGRDALDYALSGQYDGILLDIMMPRLSGLQVLRELRAAGRRTPVLLLTAKSQIEDQAQTGKVSFGVNYGEKQADPQKARENAIQCFEDGIYRIFMDDRPLEHLDDPIEVTEENIFTFVRLTMLSGRMW